MLFSAQFPQASLASVSRALSTMLEAGVIIHKAFETVGRRMGSRTVRRVLLDVSDDLRRGKDVSAALRAHAGFFPDLFVQMVEVGEQTGTMPEVLNALADHYENLVRLRRHFKGAIALPVLQLVAAVFIVAALIYLLGMIAASTPGAEPVDVLGFGLTGTDGALMFLFIAFGSTFGLAFLYLLATRGFGQDRWIHRILLRVPIVGHCMRAFAVARFAWAFALTQQAGMRLVPSLQASFRATSNGAFEGAAPEACARIREGEELHAVLANTGLFPAEFLEVVAVSETSGTVPEALERLSPRFEDQARRALSGLATALAWLVWALVAGMIIYAIFSIFTRMYLNAIQDALKGN